MIQGERPIIIFGGRGSGKTMILKSLSPEVIMLRNDLKNFQELKKFGIKYFGIYFRLKRGSLCLYQEQMIVKFGFKSMNMNINPTYELYKELIDKVKNDQIEDEPILKAGINIAWYLTLNELNLKILKTTLDQLLILREKKYITIDREKEEKISKQIIEELNSKKRNVRDFNDLKKFVNGELNKINLYSQNLTFPNGTSEKNWCSTNLEFLDAVYEILIDYIDDLKEFRIYLLFDEFENLCSYQQKIINEWIKTSKNFTVKVASKFEGMYTTMTHQGQALQDGQDYFSWVLDYDLSSNTIRNQYQKLLIKICENLLKIENYEETDIKKILGQSHKLELPRDVIDEQIKLIKENSNQEFDIKEIKDYRNKLQNAAIFRLLKKKEKVRGRISRNKNYSGFETYTFLSSGIIRFFLNLVGMAFYKAEAENINLREVKSIPDEYQSWAAYIVSRVWLEKIANNLEEYGEIMYQFIVDIGDIFRERLLNHPSEPETLTIRLIDSYNIKPLELLNTLLKHSVRESIIHERLQTSAMKAKSLKTSEKEYIINRIYSPILEISYTNRWSRVCLFTSDELRLLTNPAKRDIMKKTIKDRQHTKRKQKVLDEFKKII